MWRSLFRERDQGDTTTLDETLYEAGMAVAEQIGREAALRSDEKLKVSAGSKSWSRTRATTAARW